MATKFAKLVGYKTLADVTARKGALQNIHILKMAI